MSKKTETTTKGRVDAIIHARLEGGRWDFDVVQELNDKQGWGLKKTRLYELNRAANKEIDKIARENQSGMFGRIQSELFELYKENKEFGNLKEARQCLLSIGKLYSLVD